MADMILQSSEVIETPSGVRVSIVFGDHAEPEQATQTILIDLPVDLDGRARLPEYRAAALRHARSVIDAEMSAIQRLAGHNPS